MLASLEALKPIGENWSELVCGYLVESLSQLAVFRDRLNLKNVAQIAEMFFLFDAPLKLQQGWVLEKHHGKSAHKAIMQTVSDLTALPGVIQFIEML